MKQNRLKYSQFVFSNYISVIQSNNVSSSRDWRLCIRSITSVFCMYSILKTFYYRLRSFLCVKSVCFLIYIFFIKTPLFLYKFRFVLMCAALCVQFSLVHGQFCMSVLHTTWAFPNLMKLYLVAVYDLRTFIKDSTSPNMPCENGVNLFWFD